LAQASADQDRIENISDQISIQDGSNFTEPKSRLNIVAVVKQVGGDRVAIISLIPVGVEPHDFEPTIQQIQNAESADIVFFNGLGFESSWISRINNDNIVDTSSGVNFTMTGNTVDPRIWLDPVLVKNQIKNIEEALIKLDPANKSIMRKGLTTFLEN
jgi:zinc transport system substrate-binding protein